MMWYTTLELHSYVRSGPVVAWEYTDKQAQEATGPNRFCQLCDRRMPSEYPPNDVNHAWNKRVWHVSL
jgi:hypothetical protein